MRTSIHKVLFTGATAALVIGFGASAALATTATLTVKVTGGGSFTATTTKTVLTDNGISVTCTASTAGGSIPTKTYTNATSPVTVGTNTKLTFTKCTGPLGNVTVKVNKLPYKVQVDSKTNSKGQTDGIISGVNTSVNAGANCTFTVSGSTPGFFTNGKNTLSLTPKLPNTPLNKAQLTISGVPTGGCLGAIKNGDHPTYTSTYKVSRSIVIKSS